MALALPTYAMSCFRIPKGVCDEINKVLARFWWSGAQGKRGVHWGAWHRLTNHKREGGLGFRELTCFNLALLGMEVTCSSSSKVCFFHCFSLNISLLGLF